MLKRLRKPRPLADYSIQAIAVRLRWAREALGWTRTRVKSQRQYALQAGLASNTYNQFEKAKNYIPAEAAIKLCLRHGLTMDYIYLGDLSNLPDTIKLYVGPKMFGK